MKEQTFATSGANLADIRARRPEPIERCRALLALAQRGALDLAEALGLDAERVAYAHSLDMSSNDL